MLEAFAPYMTKTVIRRPHIGDEEDGGAPIYGDAQTFTKCRIEPSSSRFTSDKGDQIIASDLVFVGDDGAEVTAKDRLTLPGPLDRIVIKADPVDGPDNRQHHIEAYVR